MSGLLFFFPLGDFLWFCATIKKFGGGRGPLVVGFGLAGFGKERPRAVYGGLTILRGGRRGAKARWIDEQGSVVD